MLGFLMLVRLAASPVFASFSMGGAEPGGKENPGPPLYYVVQFEGPIQQEWKDQVTQRGASMLLAPLFCGAGEAGGSPSPSPSPRLSR